MQSPSNEQSDGAEQAPIEVVVNLVNTDDGVKRPNTVGVAPNNPLSSPGSSGAPPSNSNNQDAAPSNNNQDAASSNNNQDASSNNNQDAAPSNNNQDAAPSNNNQDPPPFNNQEPSNNPDEPTSAAATTTEPIQVEVTLDNETPQDARADPSEQTLVNEDLTGATQSENSRRISKQSSAEMHLELTRRAEDYLSWSKRFQRWINKMRFKLQICRRRAFGKDLKFTVSGFERELVCFASVSSQGYRSYQEDRAIAVNVYDHLKLQENTLASPEVDRLPSTNPFKQTYMFAVMDGHGIPQEGHLVSEHCRLTFVDRLAHNLSQRRLEYEMQEEQGPSETVVVDIRQQAGEAFAFTSKLKKLTNGSFDLTEIQRNLGSVVTTRNALFKTCIDIDIKLRQYIPKVAANNGCTFTGMLVQPHQLTFINIGDSRTVLANHGKPQLHNDCVAFESFDHKPTREGEKRRIEGSGHFVQGGRVDGDLAISRTLGDLLYKPRAKPFYDCPVSSEPDITCFQVNQPRNARSNVEFAILASDGFWDVFDSDEAVEYVKMRMVAYANDSEKPENSPLRRLSTRVLKKGNGSGSMSLQDKLGAICKSLASEAVNQRMSSDNITVQIVWFKDLPSEQLEVL